MRREGRIPHKRYVTRRRATPEEVADDCMDTADGFVYQYCSIVETKGSNHSKCNTPHTLLRTGRCDLPLSKSQGKRKGQKKWNARGAILATQDIEVADPNTFGTSKFRGIASYLELDTEDASADPSHLAEFAAATTSTASEVAKAMCVGSTDPLVDSSIPETAERFAIPLLAEEANKGEPEPQSLDGEDIPVSSHPACSGSSTISDYLGSATVVSRGSLSDFGVDRDDELSLVFDDGFDSADSSSECSGSMLEADSTTDEILSTEEDSDGSIPEASEDEELDAVLLLPPTGVPSAGTSASLDSSHDEDWDMIAYSAWEDIFDDSDVCDDDV